MDELVFLHINDRNSGRFSSLSSSLRVSDLYTGYFLSRNQIFRLKSIIHSF